jgi:hypothetical protein
VVEAESHKRIDQQAISLDGVVALLTDAVCAVLHAIKSRVHFFEELREGSVFGIPREGILETTFALLEL